MARQIPLPVLVDQLIDSMLVSYRANAGLLRALRQFAQSRRASRFSRRCAKSRCAPCSYIVDLLLAAPQANQASRPGDMALSFAVATLSGALTELILGRSAT